jgi:GNAT superfamily N-acetyltransferase
MRIRFIRTEETYPLRLLVLRPGGVVEDCVWANDRLEGSFHLAAQLGEHRVSVGSFYPEKHPDLKGWKQFRLRGMATHPDFQGQGAGTRLLRFALEHLKAQHADRLWCNARIKAVPFYEALGFVKEGPEFDIPGIGGHYLMHRPV